MSLRWLEIPAADSRIIDASHTRPASLDSRAPTPVQTPQPISLKKRKKTKPHNCSKEFNILAAYRPSSFSPPESTLTKPMGWENTKLLPSERLRRQLEEMEGEIMAKRRMKEYQARIGLSNGRQKAVRQEGRAKKRDDNEPSGYDVAITSESSS